MKILIVDDNENARAVLLKTLEYAGYSVEMATDGIEALAMAKHSSHDLIISDILMPEMDGFLLCHEIKADPKLKKIPFFFYSATYVDSKDEQLAMGLGASRFILKPAEENLRKKSRQMEALTQELRKLSMQLSKKDEVFRRQFARVLHEQIGQDLAAMKIMCADLLLETDSNKKERRGKIDRIVTILDNIVRSTRSLTSDLYPTILDDCGILAAIKDLAFSRNTFKVSLDLEESVEDLQQDTKLSLFRMIQEAFQNIAKYAFATQVIVELKKADTRFKLSIHDNGIGFNAGAKKTTNTGIGLALIKERSLSLGGCFNIESLPGWGTTLTVSIPIEEDPADKELDYIRLQSRKPSK